ncbi:hypothetical protein [Halosimplex sp. TS25]|uniref:hypothetical protein n=1 Tax=Halosimplex rarum TaxID=3396619 RepID=UPI0039EC997E
MAECAEEDCDAAAVVELHIPWADNRLVCAGHARVIARQDGVVADPLDGYEDAWP